MKLEIILGDITKLGKEVEIIVNAANTHLLEGGGVCGAIFRAAGSKELSKACDEISFCQTGSAVYTKAFHLTNQKYIIHTPGPDYNGCKGQEKLLADCYRNSLKLAESLKCTSIAFPSISTGIYGYPMDEAAKIATKAVKEFQGNYLQHVYMCLLPSDDKAIQAYQKANLED